MACRTPASNALAIILAFTVMAREAWCQIDYGYDGQPPLRRVVSPSPPPPWKSRPLLPAVRAMPPRPPPSPPMSPMQPSQPRVPPSTPVPPSPPPSSPRNKTTTNWQLVKQFPFLSCRHRKAKLSPLRMAAPSGPDLVDLGAGASALVYCFDVSLSAVAAKQVPRGSPCAGMDNVQRIDILVEPWLVESAAVFMATSKVSVNGYTVSPLLSSRAWNGGEYGMMSLANLTTLFPTLPGEGLSVCVELAYPSSGCPDRTDPACHLPRNYCYGPSCVYSLANKDRSCCPVENVPKSSGGDEGQQEQQGE